MSEKFRVTPFFNGVGSFKSAFPELADAQIEWRELQGVDDERPVDLRKTGYRRGNFTQGVLPCSNPDCHEGGYQLDRLVADMLRLGETSRQGIMLCSGREVGEEVRRGPVRCPHRIAYTAQISLRSEDQGPDPDRAAPSGRRSHQRRGRGRGHRRSNVA
ncbi:MAG TPA: hypothetical protein VKX16_08280 [Chloroflexota bacterium]|nr:hypothetical protein [Chloroflexota bacterium]